ncbi:hypothetical protein KKC_00372 [Listeria fleischmannii subsp. coloradonensis]|nr:hypothetical protein KKC_00372 [Listeria fleischmannii subsp. coloradonensis]
MKKDRGKTFGGGVLNPFHFSGMKGVCKWGEAKTHNKESH